MNRMQNTVALVTGAAGGMGRAHCRRLAEEGADIIALDIEAAADELGQTAREVESVGRLCVTGVADVRDQAQLDVAVADGVAALGRLDVIVANAGIYTDLGLSWELSDQAWQRTIDINLTGMWHTVRAAVPALTDGGSVVIVSSTNGIVGAAAAAHYSASKHAVVGLARTLANELGPRGIRVNTVHPGSVATPMILNAAVYANCAPTCRIRPARTRRRRSPAARFCPFRGWIRSTSAMPCSSSHPTSPVT